MENKKLRLNEAWEYQNSYDLRELLKSVFDISDAQLLSHFSKYFPAYQLDECANAFIIDNDLGDEFGFASDHDGIKKFTYDDVRDYFEGDTEGESILVDHILKYFPENYIRESLEDFLKDNDLIDEFEFFNYDFGDEGELDEDLPFDLAQAYKNTDRNYINFNRSIDFKNSDYKEVTPTEAYAIYKNNPESLHLIVDGQLVTFRENGKPSSDYRVHWISNDNVYVKSSGEVINDTRKMPASHLFKIASKIYQIDEKRKDRDLLDKRAMNPESPSSNYNPDMYGLEGSKGRSYRDSKDAILRGSDDPSDYQFSRNQQEINFWKNSVESEKADYEGGYYDDNEDGYQRHQRNLERKQKNLKDYLDQRDSLRQERRDYMARRRYGASEKALKEPFIKYRQLKSNINDVAAKVDLAQQRLKTAKEQGAPETKKVKDNLVELQSKMEALQREIRKAEIYLRGCDEDDQEEINAAEKEVNTVLSKHAELQAEMNKLLKKDN